MTPERERKLIDATNLISEVLKELPPGYSLELSFSHDDCSCDLYDFDGHEVYFDVESNESVVSTALRTAKEHVKLFSKSHGIDL